MQAPIEYGAMFARMVRVSSTGRTCEDDDGLGVRSEAVRLEHKFGFVESLLNVEGSLMLEAKVVAWESRLQVVIS